MHTYTQTHIYICVCVCVCRHLSLRVVFRACRLLGSGAILIQEGSSPSPTVRLCTCVRRGV